MNNEVGDISNISDVLRFAVCARVTTLCLLFTRAQNAILSRFLTHIVYFLSLLYLTSQSVYFICSLMCEVFSLFVHVMLTFLVLFLLLLFSHNNITYTRTCRVLAIATRRLRML